MEVLRSELPMAVSLTTIWKKMLNHSQDCFPSFTNDNCCMLCALYGLTVLGSDHHTISDIQVLHCAPLSATTWRWSHCRRLHSVSSAGHKVKWCTPWLQMYPPYRPLLIHLQNGKSANQKLMSTVTSTGLCILLISLLKTNHNKNQWLVRP